MTGRLSTAASRYFFSGWCILICLLWVFSGLVGHEPWKPDEAYSFGMVLSNIEGGNWVIPTIADVPFMEKPPFFYVLASFSAQLFYPWLEYPDGARLTNSLFLIITLVTLGLASRQLYPKETRHQFPFVSILLFISCFGLVYRTHLMITDVALLCGFSMSLYGLSLMRRRMFLAAFFLGTGVGLGFMTKGILAPGIIGSICLSLLMHPDYRKKQVILSYVLAALWSAPWLLIWPIALYMESDELFRLWFWDNNLARFLGGGELGPGAEKGFYFRLLPWYAMPALPFTLMYWWHKSRCLSNRQVFFIIVLLLSLILIVSPFHRFYAMPSVIALLVMARNLRHENERFIVPLHFFAITLGVLSLSSTARELYALPLLLPLSLMATDYFAESRPSFDKALNWLAVMVMGGAILFLWLIWLALLWPELPVIGPLLQQRQPGFVHVVSYGSLCIALLAVIFWIYITRLDYFTFKPVLSWSAGVTAAWCLLSTILLPYIDYGMSYKDMMLSLKNKLPAQYDCIASYKLVEAYPALMHYYLDEKMYEITDQSRRRNCDLMLLRNRHANRLSQGWIEVWHGSRPGDKQVFSLYAKDNPEAYLDLDRKKGDP